jgi:hypothetical protein
MAFSLLQIIFWIALATWFGGVLFIAIAAPIIFKTVKENNPILPMVLSVNLEGQHGSLLAGTIVANLFSHLKRIELICAAGLLVGLIGQWTLSDIGGDNWILPLLRSAMFIAALGLVLFDWRVVWPKLTLFRDQYIAHADEPDVANPANDEFNRYQRESELLLNFRLALLLALILFSSNIRPRQIEITTQGARTQLQPGSKTEDGEWKANHGTQSAIKEDAAKARPDRSHPADSEKDLSKRQMLARLFNAPGIAGGDDPLSPVYRRPREHRHQNSLQEI